MTCEGIDRDEQVERYLRNELDSAAQSEFEIHILECSVCLQRLEMMQAISHDLQERAAEIRVTQDTRLPWWKWLPALAAVLVVGAVVSTLKSKHPAPPVTLKTNTPQSVPTELSASPKTAIKQDTADRSAASTVARPPSSAPQIDSPALNGRRYIQLSKETPEQTDKIGDSAPPDGTATQAPPGAITAGINSQLPLAPGEGTKNNNDEVAKEIFRLGTVQAPPYTFSGLAASTKVDGKQAAKREEGLGAAMPTGQPENAQPSAQGRTYFQNAMGAYVEKRYADAVQLLEADLELEPKALDANYYLGICLLLLAQPADAIAPLKAVAASNTSALAPPAHFYLAKAYIQVEDLESAETELRTAGTGAGRLAAEARSILKKLQALKIKQ